MSNLTHFVPTKPQWLCTTCGTSTLTTCKKCSDCGTERGSYVQKTSQLSAPIDSSNAHMVQNNVSNVQVEGGVYLTDSYPVCEEKSPPMSDLLFKFFMLTCTIAFWIGILATVSVLVFFGAIMFRAFFMR